MLLLRSPNMNLWYYNGRATPWNCWLSTKWQLVGFYINMTSSPKVPENIKIHQHQHGTYLALILLMNFNMGALTWNLFFAPRWFSGE